jgi:hypothetical protein
MACPLLLSEHLLPPLLGDPSSMATTTTTNTSSSDNTNHDARIAIVKFLLRSSIYRLVGLSQVILLPC